MPTTVGFKEIVAYLAVANIHRIFIFTNKKDKK